MKEIFSQYGSIIITSFVLFSLFSILTHTGGNSGSGILGIAGNVIDVSTENKMNYEYNASAFSTYKSAKYPEITLDRNRQIYEGTEINVSDFLSIKDGVQGDFEIYAIHKFDGEVVSSSLIKSCDKVLFMEPGIYYLYMKIYNATGESFYAKLKIPVNRR